jgi:hypothetical protein
MIPIALWNPSWDNENWNILKLKDVKTKWHYTEIELNGNQEDNKIKLDFAQLKIREMITNHDTLNGVHFHFNNQSTFGNFVNAINICKIENANLYWIYKDEMWVFNFSPIKTKSVTFKELPCLYLTCYTCRICI